MVDITGCFRLFSFKAYTSRDLFFRLPNPLALSLVLDPFLDPLTPVVLALLFCEFLSVDLFVACNFFILVCISSSAC